MTFQPQDPDFEAKVRASYDRQNFMKHIGAAMTEVGPGYVVIELPIPSSPLQDSVVKKCQLQRTSPGSKSR